MNLSDSDNHIRFEIVNGKPFATYESKGVYYFGRPESFDRHDIQSTMEGIDRDIEQNENNWDLTHTDFGFNKPITL